MKGLYIIGLATALTATETAIAQTTGSLSGSGISERAINDPSAGRLIVNEIISAGPASNLPKGTDEPYCHESTNCCPTGSGGIAVNAAVTNVEEGICRDEVDLTLIITPIVAKLEALIDDFNPNEVVQWDQEIVWESNSGDDGGGDCLIGGSMVLLENGDSAAIQDLMPGHRVAGKSGTNRVLKVTSRTIKEGGPIYAINDMRAFITAGHPVMTGHGWKAIDPEKVHSIWPGDRLPPLEVGDVIHTEAGPVKIEKIAPSPFYQPSDTVYNLILTGDGTYYADGVLVNDHIGPRVRQTVGPAAMERIYRKRLAQIEEAIRSNGQ